jgi:hypothetical protein
LHAAIQLRQPADRGDAVDWKSVDATSTQSLCGCILSSCNTLVQSLGVARIVMIINAADQVAPNNEIWLPPLLPSCCSIVASCSDDWGAFATCMLCSGMINSSVFVIPDSARLTDPATVAALAVRAGLKALLQTKCESAIQSHLCRL